MTMESGTHISGASPTFEEFGRGNADDVVGRGRGTKFKLAVQDVRIPCKAALPPGVADDYDWVGEGSSRNS